LKRIAAQAQAVSNTEEADPLGDGRGAEAFGNGPARPRRPPGTAELVALLDLGSNASRFLLARVVEGDGFHVLRKERVQTRLGDGSSGRLRRAAVTATLDAVHRFLRRVSRGQSPRVLAIATAAVRDATNRALLLDALRDREGVAVHVLTGREEARLGAEAALRSLPVRNGIVADLGGSSLQLTRIRASQIGWSVSLPLGAIRLTQRFLQGDPPTADEVRALRAEVRNQVLQQFPAGRPADRLVGLGGTVRSLARIHLATESDGRSRHGLRLHRSDLTAIRSRLERLPRRVRHHVPGLKAERADTILAGILVLEELMLLFGHDTDLTVCTAGVRDGLLWSEAFGGQT
jgi:exopolyphosphatase/guanosine-5'-triphosphate,3'-diphosphate pyrophosphatase